jgi:hypothetical protein
MVKDPERALVTPIPPRRKRGALRVVGLLFRRLVQVLVLSMLVLAALTVGWLRSPDFQVRAIRAVETLIESATGERASLSRVRVQIWRPAVHVDGFELTSAQTGDTIVRAERITIPLTIKLGKLGVGKLGIGRLHLQKPEVHLHLDEKGKLVEFANRKRGGNRPLTELPWTNLAVVDGTFTLSHASGAAVVLDSLTVVPTSGSLADLSGRLGVTFRDFTDETSFSWTDVQVGPDAIDIPTLALDLDTLDLTGRAHIPLQGALDADLTAQLHLEKIQPLLKPPRAAHGTVDVDVRLEGTPQDPTLYVAASGSRLGLDMPGVFTPLLTYDLGSVALSAMARKDGIQVEQLVLPWANGRIVGWGRITPDLRLEDGHVTLEEVELAPLLQAFDAAPTPWVDFSGDGEVTWSGTLDPLRLEGDFELGVADLHVGDRPVGRPDVELMLDIPHAYAQGTLLLEKTHVLLEAPTVRGPRSAGSLNVDIGFGPRGPLNLEFDLWGADLEDFQPLADVELKGKGAISGRIAGPFNKLTFEGEGDVRDFSVLGIEYADHLVAKLLSPDMKSIYLQDAVAELGSSSYHGRYGIDFKSPVSMTTDIEIDKGRVDDMVGMFVDLEGLKGDLTGTLTLDGPLFDMSGEQHMKLANVELYGEKFPTGEGHGYMDKGLFTLDDLRVRREDGRAGLTLRGSVEREWKLDMELIADGLDLSKLDRLASSARLPLTGKIGAQARITNTLFDPSPDGRLWLTDLEYAGVPAEDSVILVDSEGGIARYHGSLLGGTASVEGTLGLWQEQPYALTAKLDKLPAHMFYPTAADGTPITAVVSGTVDVSGHFGEVWSPVTLTSRIDGVEVRYANHVLRNNTPWTYAQRGDTFRLEGFSLKGISGGTGSTDVHLSATRDDSLFLVGDGTVDLDLLRAFVPGLEKSTGVANVSFTAAGQRKDAGGAGVEAVVNIDVASELFRHESAPLAFEDTRARIQVRDDRIDLLSLEGSLGGGTFSGSGTIDARDWKPVRYDLAMNVKDAMVQWVESLPPAIGDGTFRFDGPVGALLLSGDVNVTDMTFAERIDWEDWVVEYRDWMVVDPALVTDEPPMFNLNVHLGADRTIWLRNNVAEAVASADLRIIGDTVRPGLVGTVHVQEGLAFLQDREFRIDRGDLLFNDPWTWDPQLDLALQTDITSRDQRYRVEYQVLGPFSDWRTESRSDPFLPQADVNALLWFGVTTDELEEMGELQSAVVQSVADLLVTDFLVSGQAGDIGEELPNFLFDRIDLATGVNARGEYSPEPRLVVEKRLPTEVWELDLKWEFNPLRPNDNYVTASKRLGGIWNLAGWYASLQRDRALPIGGAYGVDVLARWEIE